MINCVDISTKASIKRNGSLPGLLRLIAVPVAVGFIGGARNVRWFNWQG